jgi:hypothetical protein
LRKTERQMSRLYDEVVIGRVLTINCDTKVKGRAIDSDQL